MMKIAVMQPYLFPYIGYFQLIDQVDKFVIYDDVTYMKQSWINRNRILLDDQEFTVTLQVIGASSFILINQVTVGNNQKKLLKTISQAYQKAPYFRSIFPVIEDILSNEENDLAKYVTKSLRDISEYLEITTEFVISSELQKNNDLKNQDKIIDICGLFNADCYINAIGGRSIYSGEIFSKKGISLKFIKTQQISYKQFDNVFVPELSIIDVMMFNSKDQIRTMLNRCELI